MKLYRFSPIESKEDLFEVIKYVHSEANRLCKDKLGEYLDNAGNVGVFCHYKDEFVKLKKIRESLTESSDDPNQKYFRLLEPVVVQKQEDIPKTVYTHLYIRRPDPYRHHVGDVDFFLEPEEYEELKQSLIDGKEMEGVRIFERPDLDMIELYDPDVDVLAYVSTKSMTEKVRVKLSDATKL